MLNTLFRNKKVETYLTYLLAFACVLSFVMLDGREATVYSPETISVFGLMVAAYHWFTLYIVTPVKVLTEILQLCASSTLTLLSFEHIHVHNVYIGCFMLALALVHFGTVCWRELSWKPR